MMTAQDNLDKAARLVRQGKIQAANTLLGTFGVERLDTPDGEHYQYLNNGETYSPTVIWPDGRESCAFVSSWGFVFESTEDAYCRENNVIRCGYCGEYTPNNADDWSEVICEHCGQCVAG